MAMQLVNTIFIGHIGTEGEIAGAGMANMTMNIFGLSLTIGLA
jgi:Na+-driven multidrug efflux pump